MVSESTCLPSLIFLGFWWGKLGKKFPSMSMSFNLGLMSLLGTLLVGLTLWFQKYLIYSFDGFSWFNEWAIHTAFSQAIVTALFAPIICSWLLFAWKIKPKSQKYF